MLELIRTLFNICLLRKGPEDLPRSGILLAVALALLAVPEFLTHNFDKSLTSRDLLLLLVSLGIGLAVYAAILLINSKGQRFVQTATAIVGANAVLSTIAFLLLGSVSALLDAGAAQTALMVVLLWSITVEGHIFSRALEQHLSVGIAFAMLVFIMQLMLYMTFGGVE